MRDTEIIWPPLIVVAGPTAAGKLGWLEPSAAS